MTFRLAESSESGFQASLGRVEHALSLRRFIHSALRGPLGGSSARLGVSERRPLCQGHPLAAPAAILRPAPAGLTRAHTAQ